MYTNFNIIKKDLGYSVDIGHDYFAVGNPSLDAYIESNPSETYEGEVDIYKRNIDTFQFYKILNRKTYFNPFNNVVDYNDIVVVESDFGRSVSIFENYCAISATTGKFFVPSSSYVLSSSIYYNFSNPTLFEYSHPIDSYDVIEIYDLYSGSNNPIHYISSKMVPVISGSIEAGIKSFGTCVSMNGNFLVVGDPYTRYDQRGIYRGSVHIFSGSVDSGYTYQTTITGSNSQSDVEFGFSLKIDKNFNKIVVGNGNIYSGSSNVYLFELINNDWIETQVFAPSKKVENLEYVNFEPIQTIFNNLDCFGNSVSIYCKTQNDATIVVGAPFDRTVRGYETTESYNNGAIYVFERRNCVLTSGSISVSSSYYETTRLSGSVNNFKDNRLGHSVSIYDDYIIASSPRICAEQSSSYIQNTFYQQFINESVIHDGNYQGLIYVYERNLNGNSWGISAYYKPRKVYGIPHKFFGYSTSIYDENVLIGSPITITDNNRHILVNTGRNNVNKNLQGNFNLINIGEYKEEHHVGNIFYKNGIIVISTSGSAFDDMFETNLNDFLTYDLKFENQQKLYQKEVICTINPGEFNRSTNPSSYHYYPNITFDINKNARFDFEDCDLLLRFLSKYLYNTEYWWEILGVNDETLNVDYKVENSRFTYYSRQRKMDITTNLLSDSSTFDLFESTYLSLLDTNDDGIADKNDMFLLWKYFANTLTFNNYMQYMTKNSFKNRRSYDLIISYLHNMCGKNSKPMCLSHFIQAKKVEYGYSTDITMTSSLCPYITTVGLYQGADLVAVAKLGTPIKNSGDFPLNIIVRMDY